MKLFNPIEILEGDNLLLRALCKDDFNQLYTAMSDPEIWAGHPQKHRYKKSAIKEWFASALKEQALAIIDKNQNQIIGSSRYYETDIEKGETSIGYTFLVTQHWGGHTNRELKELMFRHAWKYFDTVWLHIAEDNIRSQKAAEKIGAQLHHIGTLNDHPYCWYLLPKESI